MLCVLSVYVYQQDVFTQINVLSQLLSSKMFLARTCPILSSIFKIAFSYPDTSNPFKYTHSSNRDKLLRVKTQYTTLDQ